MGDDAVAVARPQGEGSPGREDDVGGLPGRRTAAEQRVGLQAEGGAGDATDEGRRGRRRGK
jgi:hypothetical protein